MESIQHLISGFLKIADQQTTGQGITPDAFDFIRKNKGAYEGLEIEISFGIGRAASIPWMAFLGYGQSVQKGIYPVLLYYKEQKILVLAYGVSETHPPDQDWPKGHELTSISSYFKKHFEKRPERYGTSYVYYVYQTHSPLNASIAERDLENLVKEYHAAFANKTVNDPRASYERLKPLQTDAYTRDMALEELFLSEEKLDKMMRALENKKNIILQGPPGTGKTFLAKRLAYLMLEKKENAHIQMIQFHQSYAYEDFIQGYRPSQDGKFELKNGLFYSFCQKAQNDPGNAYFFIIDEINRGNLGKIFGELMLLMENDKRGEAFAIPLTYSASPENTFYIPSNLYIIGTMNTADRSLAMVDYALRRRFSFIHIGPQYESLFEYLIGKGASTSLSEKIRKKMTELNETIAADLGKGFCIGHSYFCGKTDSYDESWYKHIVEHEIEPLLGEYWFDDDTKVETSLKKLLS